MLPAALFYVLHKSELKYVNDVFQCALTVNYISHSTSRLCYAFCKAVYVLSSSQLLVVR